MAGTFRILRVGTSSSNCRGRGRGLVTTLTGVDRRQRSARTAQPPTFTATARRLRSKTPASPTARTPRDRVLHSMSARCYPTYDPGYSSHRYHSISIHRSAARARAEAAAGGFKCLHDCWSNPDDQDWVRIESTGSPPDLPCISSAPPLRLRRCASSRPPSGLSTATRARWPRR